MGAEAAALGRVALAAGKTGAAAGALAGLAGAGLGAAGRGFVATPLALSWDGRVAPPPNWRGGVCVPVGRFPNIVAR